MGAGLTVRARAGRPEDDYEGDDWEGGYGRGEYGRRRGRRESPPHSRSRRHRCLPHAGQGPTCTACLNAWHAVCSPY